MSNLSQDPIRNAAGEFVQDYEWLHTIVGILGNATFVIGSVFFLLGWRTPATYLFIAGSSGMLIGSVGAALVRRARRREVLVEDDQRQRGG